MKSNKTAASEPKARMELVKEEDGTRVYSVVVGEEVVFTTPQLANRTAYFMALGKVNELNQTA